MATAARVLKSALQKILVQASEQSFQASEYADAIDTLNDLMLAWDADGISLGYTIVSDLGDEITVPTGALRGIIYNLAVELAPEYGGVITPTLQTIANDSYKTVMRLGQVIEDMQFPSTLPIGSGNEYDTGYAYTHFFPETEDEILSETTGSILLESGTNEAAS